MKKFIQKYWLYIVIPITVLSVFTPQLLEWVYPKDEILLTGTNFMKEDLLSFYGSFLAFLGTMILGVVAWKQNSKANKISEDLINIEKHRTMSFPQIISKDMYVIIPKEDGSLSKDAKRFISKIEYELIAHSGIGDGVCVPIMMFYFKVKNVGNTAIKKLKIKNVEFSHPKLNDIEVTINFNDCLIDTGNEIKALFYIYKVYTEQNEIDSLGNGYNIELIKQIHNMRITFEMEDENLYRDIKQEQVSIFTRINEEEFYSVGTERSEIKLNKDFKGIIKINKYSEVKYIS